MPTKSCESDAIPTKLLKELLIKLGGVLTSLVNLSITRKCRIAMGNLQKLKKIGKCLTLDAAKTIALGLVISHLDYAKDLYYGLPATEIKKLQRIQNMAAKIVAGADRHDSSTEALKSLHWLPFHLRIEYKVLTLVFKSLHGLAQKAGQTH